MGATLVADILELYNKNLMSKNHYEMDVVACLFPINNQRVLCSMS
jgi:hypothetical protein